MLKDRDILLKLNAHDEQGIEALFIRYYKPLVVFAGSYLHNLPEAEDLVQEQIVKLWTKRAFTPVKAEAFSTFLFTVIKNACLNWLEKRKLSLTSLEFPHLQIAQEEASHTDDERVKLIAAILEKLPLQTRRVVDFVILQDKTYKQAAEELNVSVNTVKTLLKQGIKGLRCELKDRRDRLIFLYIYHRMRRKTL